MLYLCLLIGPFHMLRALKALVGFIFVMHQDILTPVVLATEGLNSVLDVMIHGPQSLVVQQNRNTSKV